MRFLGVEVTIENPAVAVEKDNIDILVSDKNYAFIIENKINGAGDQREQIKRYVESVENNYGYDISKIYVAYLTRWGNKEVSENSLPDDLKTELGKRFLPINYREHILPWMKETLPELPLKETLLISGMRQYIDTLKGMFNLRKNQKDMMNDIKKPCKKNCN